MNYLEIAQAIHHLPEYTNIIQHLTNGTMRQAIHIMDPGWVDGDRIERRTYKMAELMGLLK